MSRVGSLLLVLALVSTAFGQNLFLNPGFETPNATNDWADQWTHSGGAWRGAGFFKGASPHADSAYAVMAASNGLIDNFNITQTLSPLPSGSGTYDVTVIYWVWLSDLGADSARASYVKAELYVDPSGFIQFPKATAERKSVPDPTLQGLWSRVWLTWKGAVNTTDANPDVKVKFILSGDGSDAPDNWGVAVLDDVEMYITTPCPTQHTVNTPISPATHDNISDTTITLSGTNLSGVTSVKLLRYTTELVGINLTPGGGGTSLQVTFPTTGAAAGKYDLLVEQQGCAPRWLQGAFTLSCANPTAFTGVSPNLITAGPDPVTLTITGTNVNQLTGVSLKAANGPAAAHIVDAMGVAASGNDLLATFDLSCLPAGLYSVAGTRSDACPNPDLLPAAVRITKPISQGGCAWRPWAAGWSDVIKGSPVILDTEIYNPVNWDYTLSQSTSLNLPLDTPDGSSKAMHFFFADSTVTPPNSKGSGGVYQQITVQPGVPLEYSYSWKGIAANQYNWVEFLLVDGPFSIFNADMAQDNIDGNNPYLLHKQTPIDNSFGWETITHLSPAENGPAGPRPTTITPTGNVVTVILKAGHNGATTPAAIEVLFDNIVVKQNNGPSLVANGTFEDADQASVCDNEWMAQDSCEKDYWMVAKEVCNNAIDDDGDGMADCADPDCSSTARCQCNTPWADADDDDDVDQEDFGVFQACFNGDQTGTPGYCLCFDRPDVSNPDGDTHVDSADLAKFIDCISGPEIAANLACGQ